MTALLGTSSAHNIQSQHGLLVVDTMGVGDSIILISMFQNIKMSAVFTYSSIFCRGHTLFMVLPMSCFICRVDRRYAVAYRYCAILTYIRGVCTAKYSTVLMHTTTKCIDLEIDKYYYIATFTMTFCNF